MNSDVAGRGGDGVGGAEAASVAAASTGGLFTGPKGWRWRWLWWWQCRGGSDEGCGCGGNGMTGTQTRGSGSDGVPRIACSHREPTSPGASTGVGGSCGGNGGDLYAHKGRRGQQRRCATYRVCYTQGAGGATGVGGGGSGCDGNGGDLYVHKGKRGDVDVSSKLKRSWRAPRDGVEATVGATGLVHMGWSRGGSNEGWCHRQRDITRVRMRGVDTILQGFEVKGKKKTYQHGTRQNDSRRVALQHSQLVTKLHESVRLKRCGDERGKDHVAKTTAWEKFFPCSTGNLWKRATCYSKLFSQVPQHKQRPQHDTYVNRYHCHRHLSSRTHGPYPVVAPTNPCRHHSRFHTMPVPRAPTLTLSFPHRSLQHRAGKTLPSLIRRDDTMARDDMSRCDNLTTCKNRTGYEHRPPRHAKPHIDVRRAGGHNINTAPQPYGTAVRLRHRLGPATLQCQWDVARTRHLPRRLQHQQHNGIIARPQHRRSLQALPRRYGANTAARKPRRVPTTLTAARQAGVR
ncbi:hypothetical protein EDB89DRAFT_1916392 [Lactarius sanguifluus]|nr:hypothetical protein EDB89DRAFT_1916392 [Lactarius sanguifluus]